MKSCRLPSSIAPRCFLTVALALLTAFSAAARPAFEFHQGDRVALLGDTLIEREPNYGYLEERLTVQYPDKTIFFRNLGWSADTPAGESRASFDFDKPGKGFELLKQEITNVQPSVVIVGYGMANSFQGEAGLPSFKTNLNQLLDALQSASTNKPVRFIFLSPIRHEDLGRPLPDPVAHNKQLALYTRAIDEIATERQGVFVSLFDQLLGDGTKSHPPRPFTDDGIHLTAYGYLRMTEAVEKSLVWEPDFWRVEITPDGKVTEGSYGTTVSGLQRTGNGVRFTSLDKLLVSPNIIGTNGPIPTADAGSLIQIDGLKAGHYELKVDGVPLLIASNKEWERGVALDHGPQFDQAEKLRAAIIEKNQLYFDRWRPQNETYLFGFRKYEQGQNAKEIPQFDPLIEAQEKLIATLKQPVAHTYELVAVSHSHLPVAKLVKQKPESEADVFPKSLPPQALPNFDVAPGFEISLYAESPMLAKPIQMNFDPQGRLWVVSSSVYPQIQPGRQPDDKVLILEDTKGVGHVDKSTVFVDGLMIPTGVEPGDGGVYVGQGTELLFFKDTTGTGKANQKRIVLSGFGTEDTHHLLHTLDWGPDGQLYFDQSIYIHTHIETPYGVERLNSGGIWHLREPTMELGVFVRGFCNPWGHQFDQYGQSFITDGAGNQGISYGIPGATYFTYASMRREMKSVSPGNYPKFCALELIRSRQFPDDWQGNAITCDFRAHRILRFAIDEKGGGYITREMPDLVRTTNVTFRPIDLKLGPDGALYVADWSNPIIQHGEVDFRDPRRDHEHGRIWRITAKGRPVLKRPSLVKASNSELFRQLLSPEKYNQQEARRVLTERGTNILTDLAKWTKAQTNEMALLQSLWMYQSVDVVEPALLKKLLKANDSHVRAAATRVVGYWRARLSDPMALLTDCIHDSFPRVQIEAMRALAEIPSAKSAELILSVLDKPVDPFVDYAVWLSINDLAGVWVKAVATGEWNPAGHEKQLEYALKAIEPAQATVVLAQVLQNMKIPTDGSGPWIDLIGQSGGEADVKTLYGMVSRGEFSAATTARALHAIGEAVRLREMGKKLDPDVLVPLFTGANEQTRAESIKLAGALKSPSSVAPLLAVVKADSTKPADEKLALQSLRDIGGSNVVQEISVFVKTAPPAARNEAALILASLDVEKGKQPVIDALNALKDDASATAYWHEILAVKGLPAALAKSLPTTGLSPIMAKVGLRVTREGGRNEPDLVVALTRGADLEGEGMGLTDAEMKQLGEHASQSGNAARGELIFRRTEIGCVNCHAIGGVGGKVGPDMTSIGASAPIDYLVESVFYPNRKIKEGYHSVLVETQDGEELAGILVRENNEELILRDTTNKEISIAKKNIKTRTLGNSLMPSGLIDSLDSMQRLDLFKFLSELGKPGPFDASKGNVARYWKLFPVTIDASQFGDEKIANSKLTNSGWYPAYSLVDGKLLKSELKVALKNAAARDPKSIFAAAQVQVTGGEPFQLKVGGIAAEKPIWIDGVSAKQDKPFDQFVTLPVHPGLHIIMIKFEVDTLPEYVRFEVKGGTFLAN